MTSQAGARRRASTAMANASSKSAVTLHPPGWRWHVGKVWVEKSWLGWWMVMWWAVGIVVLVLLVRLVTGAAGGVSPRSDETPEHVVIVQRPRQPPLKRAFASRSRSPGVRT